MTEFYTQFVIFPAGKQTAAQAYKAFGDTWSQGITGEPDGQLGLIFNDRHGQWVTTYAGPNYTYDGINVEPEPEDGPAMRADGVLARNYDAIVSDL